LLAALLSAAAAAAFGQGSQAPDAVPLSRAQVVKELAEFQKTHEWNAWLGEWQLRVGTGPDADGKAVDQGKEGRNDASERTNSAVLWPRSMLRVWTHPPSGKPEKI
jgi:hypothetical protein